MKFDNIGVRVKDKNTKTVLTTGRKLNGLYRLESKQSIKALYSSRQRSASDEVWHRRLGHPHQQLLQHLSANKRISISSVTKKMCASCQLGKSSRLPFQSSSFVAKRPLEKVHCDLWGPAPTMSVQGFRFYVIFVDHWSRYCWIYPMKYKSEFYSIFCKFQALVENQLRCRIGTFQCDGGGEFISSTFLEHLQKDGIKQQMSCPYTPEQNGLAERKHRHITELGLSMMFDSKTPLKFWVEAFFTAVFLANLLPTSTLPNHQTPYQKLFGKRAEYTFLRTFGCACYPSLRDYAHNKFDPRSLKCVFLGYNDRYKGYRCLYPPTGRVYITRNALFDEEEFPFANVYKQSHPSVLTPLLKAWQKSFIPTAPSSQAPQLTPVESVVLQSDTSLFTAADFPPLVAAAAPVPLESASPSPTPSSASAPSPQEVPVPHQGHSMITRAKAGIVKPNPRYVLLTQKVAIPEPRSVAATLNHPGWHNAMQEEYDTCEETNTFTLVPRTPDMHVLGSGWVHRVKLNADGTLNKLKSRVVASGNEQEEGVDYLETYSPVVRMASVRTILHMATVLNWEIKQMDVKNAFLHGDLHEKVFMRQPSGFVDKQKPDHVWSLNKAIYGLKQAPRAWFDKFSTFLIDFGFRCFKSDPSLFVYTTEKDIIILMLYVDDMVVTGNSSEVLSKLLQQLNKEFRMKDLGMIHYFLGIQVQSHDKGLFLCQQKYAEDLLAVASMSDCSSMPTPLPLQLNKVQDQGVPFSNPTYFRSLAGKLQYLTLTRPNIQFAVNYVCQKMHAPTVSDFTLLKRILRYVKGTLTMGISLHKDTDFTLTAYSDSDWAGCNITRRSTGGFSTFLGKNLISWSSRKQPTVSKSSTEAEYRTLSETASEITWLCSIFRELGIPLLTTPLLLCYNLSAVLLSANPSFHSRTKHFALDYHYVRERVALGALEVKHIPNHQQIADIFTKSLPLEAFSTLRGKLGVDSIATPSLRGPISHSASSPSVKPNLKPISQSETKASQRSSSSTCKQDKINCTQAAQLKQKEKHSTAGKPQPVSNKNRFEALQDNEDQ